MPLKSFILSLIFIIKISTNTKCLFQDKNLHFGTYIYEKLFRSLISKGIIPPNVYIFLHI